MGNEWDNLIDEANRKRSGSKEEEPNMEAYFDGDNIIKDLGSDKAGIVNLLSLLGQGTGKGNVDDDITKQLYINLKQRCEYQDDETVEEKREDGERYFSQ